MTDSEAENAVVRITSWFKKSGAFDKLNFFSKKSGPDLDCGDLRAALQPLPGEWLCPFCGQCVSAPQWNGLSPALATDPQIVAHLRLCPVKSASRKAEMLPWRSLMLRVVERRLRRLPQYSFADAEGRWICPHCLRKTEALQRNWDGSEAPDDLFFPAVHAHLECCSGFEADPLEPHAAVEVQAAMGAGSVREVLLVKVASDLRFRVCDEAGSWLCPFCLRLDDSINLFRLSWGMAAQNAVVGHLLDPNCCGHLAGWETELSLERFQRLVGKLSAEREARRTQRRMKAEATVELEQLRQQIRSGETKILNIKKALEAARGAQRRLLPDAPPDIPQFELSAHYAPSVEIGGDLFNFIPAGGAAWGIVVGDVTGHGIDAALMMASAMKSFALRGAARRDPAGVLREVNGDLLRDLQKGKFVSAFYCVLDPEKGSLRCARAGHCPALLLTPPTAGKREAFGEVRELTGKGPALGIVNETMFAKALEEYETDFPPGATLLLYTDGVTEAMNAAGEEFAVPRLKNVLTQLPGRPAPMVVEKILDAVNDFSGGVAAEDDLTLVAIRRLF